MNRYVWLGPQFFLLQAGTALSLCSGYITRFALAWWCLKETRSVVIFSSLIALSAAAEIYLKPFLASFGDQCNRVKFIVCCQIIVLLMTILFSLSFIAGLFHIFTVTTGLIVISAVASVREPTIMGLIPDLVPEGDISRAMSSRTATNSLMMLSGPVVATTLISWFSAGVALYVAAALQGLSCLAFLILAIKNVPTHPPLKKGNWFNQTKEGFIAIYHVRSERYIALICSAINFTMFPFFSVIMPFWMISERQLPASYLGGFEFSFALGLLASGLYLSERLRTFFGRFGNVICGFVLLGGSVIGIVMVQNIILSIVLAFFSGMAFSVINMTLSTLRTIATPRHYRTRMFAMAAFLSSLANPVGVIIAGWFIHNLGVTLFAFFSGILMILIVPVLLGSTHLKNALSLEEDEMKDYYEKTYSNAFREHS